MEGCASIMLEAIDQCPEPILYVELGIAEGRTLSAMAEYISSKGYNFKCIGVDIESGWSLNVDEVANNIKGLEDHVTVSLSGSQDFLSRSDTESISFLLIDACHARECCARDFLAAETKIKRGGFAAFHDTAPFAQNIQPQPHCNEPCNVLLGLMDLGLLEGTRPGWTLFNETKGEEGGENHGMMIFRKD